MFPSAAQVQGTPCYSRRWKYGVHFCFSNQEIKDSLIGHFKNAFHLKGIKTTIEDLENTGGEEISQIAVKAIQNSRSSIVVFCRKFALNPRCLDELATINDCMLRYKQVVHPLFFQIAPAEVRHVLGCYEEAMNKHLVKFNDGMKVIKWRVLLYNAANLSGLHFLSGSESQLIDQIVEKISVRIHDPSCNGNCLAGRQLSITEPKTPFGPRSCDGVDTVGENGIEGTVNGDGTQHDMTHTHIRGCRSTNSKNACRYCPNDAGLQPFFTSSCRKVRENVGRFIMGQPSTSAGSTSKIPLGPEMMDRMQYNGQSNFHYSEWNGMKKSERISKGFSTDAGNVIMRTREDVKYQMQILLAFVSEGFCKLLSVGSIFKAYMEEKVLPFCADEKISQDLVKALKKILSSFTHWSQYYENANATLETTNAELSKFHQLQRQVEALRNESKQAGSDEKKSDDLLEHLQKRKDNFEVQLPRIKGEQARALLTQKYIEQQWWDLVGGFNETLVSELGYR